MVRGVPVQYGAQDFHERFRYDGVPACGQVEIIHEIVEPLADRATPSLDLP